MKNAPNRIGSCRAISAIALLVCMQHGRSSAQSFAPDNMAGATPQSAGLLLAKNEAATSFSSVDLPDAPSAQIAEAQQDNQTAKPVDSTPLNPISLLSPRLVVGMPLTAHDKFEIYIHKAYSPAAVVYPVFGAAIRMARPNKNYPEEWQDGMGAFGRNYGDSVARRTAKTTAEFTTEILAHEDPRYQPSTSSNPIARIGHALALTIVDKSDAGHSMLAVSTFTGAAAEGFVGMAYLPDGYNDVTHAEQRMYGQIGNKAISNIITEFEPSWGPFARKLKVPKLLPRWWTPTR